MAETINVQELVAAFGRYQETNNKTIYQKLIQKTFTQGFMTTIVQDGDYRASQSIIDDLVQGFQKDWTPKGKAKFTPIEIRHRRHKFDKEFYPDEIMASWLGFLADETKDRKDWPITRYILEKLILPKVEENREMKLIANGVYAAPTEGEAQATGLSMDGFLTILQAKEDAGTSNINFIELEPFTTDNIVDEIEKFVDAIDELYQGMDIPIFISNKWYKAYKRKYRELYGTNLDYLDSKNSDKVDYSNNRLQVLPSMASSDRIVCTPKENFIRLIKQNDGASKVFIESVDRKVKIWADWHENVGFAIEEVVWTNALNESSGS